VWVSGAASRVQQTQPSLAFSTQSSACAGDFWLFVDFRWAVAFRVYGARMVRACVWLIGGRVGVLVTLACALLALAGGAQLAHAGTWYINPTIINETQATNQGPCGSGHSTWVGCMILDTSSVDDGNFVANPFGATGGRHTLPAGCGAGFSCGSPFPNVDQPRFQAPYLDEGADGHFAYTMPDGNHYSLVAEDDENGLGYFPIAYPGCGAASNEQDAYVCLATYPSGVVGNPSSSPFGPVFRFYPQGTASPMAAAGQVCSVGSGTQECTSNGRSCIFPDKADGQLTCQPVQGGGEWGPTDPNNFMFLNFYDIGSTGPVTVTDLGAPNLSPGYFYRIYPSSCTLHGAGDTCALYTSGGCALPVPNSCGSDAIQISDSSGNASVEILDQAEVPLDQATDQKGITVGAIIAAITEAFTGGLTETHGGTRLARAPVLGHMRVSGGPAGRQPSASGVLASARRAGSRLTVSYRDSEPATTVFTLARERRGVRRGGRCMARVGKKDDEAPGCTRWVTLPGVHRRFISEQYWTPRTRGRACPAGAVRLARVDSSCHLLLRLFGHLRHRDQAGANTLHFTRVDGRRLAAGRYRLTAVAGSGVLESPPVRAMFMVRG
jgi:hypothetical protein